jgi:hypothetical protein
MSEQILHGAQVGTSLEKMSGEAVPKGMRERRHVLANDGANASDAERTTPDPEP